MDRRSLFPFTVHGRICDRCNQSSTTRQHSAVPTRRPSPTRTGESARAPLAFRAPAPGRLRPQLRLCAAHCPPDHCPPPRSGRLLSLIESAKKAARPRHRQRTEVLTTHRGPAPRCRRRCRHLCRRAAAACSLRPSPVLLVLVVRPSSWS